MPLGQGRYDDECSLARMAAGAAGAMLIIIGGRLGNGFSAQLPAHVLPTVPAALRAMADEIEQSLTPRGRTL
jgi:hypothetical protein